MKFVDLIGYLLNPERLEGLYVSQGIELDAEAYLIYMYEFIDINSPIKIFTFEETDDDLIYVKNGVKYFELFEVNHTIDLLNHDLELAGKGFSNAQIAERLMEYKKNDA